MVDEIDENERRADTLAVEHGLEYWMGRVRAELERDGRLHVTDVLAGTPRSFEGRLDGTRADELLNRAAKLRGVVAARDYAPVPDESPYRIELRVGGRVEVDVELWRHQLDEYEDARAVVDELREAVRRASDGRAIL